MYNDQLSSFEGLFAAIGRKLDADPELKQLLSDALVLLSGERPEAIAAPEEIHEEAAIEPQTTEPESAAATEPSPSPASPEDLASLVQSLAQGLAPQTAAPVTQRLGGPAPLVTIKARIEIKQEAIKLAVERAEARLRGENVHSTGQWFYNVISKAKTLPNCYLWMCQPLHDTVNPQTWRQTGICFHVLSKALSLAEEVQRMNTGNSVLERMLHLLAEAQSAVRTACRKFNFEDADQLDVYLTLLSWSAAEQLYIGRFMKAEDHADPSQSQDLMSRIDNLAQEVAAIHAEKQARLKLLGKIRYEVKMLANDPMQTQERWAKIISSVDALISNGLPASNADLRSILIDHLDDLPEDCELPEGFKRFMSAVDTHLANVQPEKASRAEDISTPEVQKVAAHLKDAEIVIIGGDCRNESKRSLIRAFGLSDLNWIETRPHETTSQFESAIARNGVKLVLLAIRWSSHSYGDVKSDCDRYGKTLVRLPRGYGVNQVAAEICKQCTLS